jgi:hypothetical protein
MENAIWGELEGCSSRDVHRPVAPIAAAVEGRSLSLEANQANEQAEEGEK